MIGASYGSDVLKGNVVIVEDDELMQRVILEIFADLGGNCTAFFTADDALIYLMQTKSACALLVTDYTLPGQLDGKELALMVHGRWSNIPVIVTTGYGSEVGNDLPPGIAFIRKPWTVEQMVQTVNKLIMPHI